MHDRPVNALVECEISNLRYWLIICKWMIGDCYATSIHFGSLCICYRLRIKFYYHSYSWLGVCSDHLLCVMLGDVGLENNLLLPWSEILASANDDFLLFCCSEKQMVISEQNMLTRGHCGPCSLIHLPNLHEIDGSKSSDYL